MKICDIRIKGFQQFQDTYLDFTHPTTGDPLDKICFIGTNGTGKTTILNLIDALLNKFSRKISTPEKNFASLIKLKEGNEEFYALLTSPSEEIILLSTDIENNTNDFDTLNKMLDDPILVDTSPRRGFGKMFNKWRPSQDIIQKFYNKNYPDLISYIPSESFFNLQINDVPSTNLDKALDLFNSLPNYNIISNESIASFWTLLIYHIKKRDNERQEFENSEKNIDKTKRQLIDEFEQISPKILDEIARVWNRILEKAGLEFDIEGANNPIQLTDNLHAYIRLKHTKERVPYKQLSTGIRNFIFQIGHLYSLYFNREVESGFLLVDEPENSLFPDFLYSLIQTYTTITTNKSELNNTQMFFATHNPIIAAQFEPYERIILEWDEPGYVKAFKGNAPLEDDPNDLLVKDFHVSNLMGNKGTEMWDLYLKYRKELRHTKMESRKEYLISEISRIGSLYNFEVE
jgi:predicted ATP-dependent endonuclease of OLD family